MNSILTQFSNMILPLIILFILAYGIIKKVNIYAKKLSELGVDVNKL